ncbi:MAG: ribokinase [Proteobacteria bacterium]|nr:ribokinase [Pseudomonadota bacterium]
MLARSLAVHPGGKGANQAVAAARCGAAVRMCGRTGADGALVVSALRQAGVDVGALQQDDPSSGTAVVMVSDEGENSIVVAPEANARLPEASVAAFLAQAAPGELALFQNECAGLAAGIRAAHARGLRVWLNAAPADDTVRGVDLALLAGLAVNETEAEAMSGHQDPEAALQALAKRMPAGTVILTLGAAGAIAADGSRTIRHTGYRVHAVDTVGCGDAFVGASLAALAEGRALEDAMAWGNAAGALAAMKQGAIPSLPGRAEVVALAATQARSPG